MKRFPVVTLILSLATVLCAQGDVPAHHKTAPKKTEKLAPILAKEQLLGPNFRHPTQKRAYELAAQVYELIYQQPCYCRCDRSVGHTSLRTCFETDHAAHCAACMQEGFYTYLEAKKGKTAVQIREGILKGEWEKINLDTAYTIQ
ncbi:MAG: PCYCGC motif-containing (lipo)protein [Candidatus Korobacteraceae bacterium]